MGKPVLVMFMLLMTTVGCGLKTSIIGEYYLNRNTPDNGIRALSEETRAHPCDAYAHYYLGRLYLSDNRPSEGLNSLRQAVELNPGSADFHFWLGIAYAATHQPEMERKSYLKALSIRKDHIQALTYLGHNQLESGELTNALATYSTVLKLWPSSPEALYNRAVILKRLGRTSEELDAWKGYLQFHPSGSFARTAVHHLNASGDFDYRNAIIGYRTVPLKTVRFTPMTAEILDESKPWLNLLGEMAVIDPALQLHVIAYQNHNASLAEARAKSVKRYLIDTFPDVSENRIKVSWFSVPEIISIDSSTWPRDASIHFIGTKQKGESYGTGKNE